MTIVYPYRGNLYINLTNRCTNNCVFCLRHSFKGVGGYNLWLEKEPSAQEVIEAIGDPAAYEEIVFCGFGEPTLRLETMLEICRWLQEKNVRVRVDTNGHGDLIHGESILPGLQGLVHVLSISLNAHDAKTYKELCRPEFGSRAYEGLLEFAQKAPDYVPEVILSVVNLSRVDLDKCREIALKMGVGFKIREHLER